jgi:hypothetical protein
MVQRKATQLTPAAVDDAVVVVVVVVGDDDDDTPASEVTRDPTKRGY